MKMKFWQTTEDDLNRATTGFDSGLEDTKLALTAISDDGFSLLKQVLTHLKC